MRTQLHSIPSACRAKRNESSQGKQADQLDIAVIRLPRLSNFTDFDPLQEEKDVHFRYITHLSDWGEPDVVLLPGSKNTMDDLRYLNESGLAERCEGFCAIRRMVGSLVFVQAIRCLGAKLLDPNGYESDHPELEGLGLLPTETVFTSDKRTVQVQGSSTLFAKIALKLLLMAMKSTWGGRGICKKW